MSSNNINFVDNTNSRFEHFKNKTLPLLVRIDRLEKNLEDRLSLEERIERLETDTNSRLSRIESLLTRTEACPLTCNSSMCGDKKCRRCVGCVNKKNSWLGKKLENNNFYPFAATSKLAVLEAARSGETKDYTTTNPNSQVYTTTNNVTAPTPTAARPLRPEQLQAMSRLASMRRDGNFFFK